MTTRIPVDDVLCPDCGGIAVPLVIMGRIRLVCKHCGAVVR